MNKRKEAQKAYDKTIALTQEAYDKAIAPAREAYDKAIEEKEGK